MKSHEIIIDYLYQKSPLQYFMNMVKVGTPHFMVHEPERELFLSTEHYKTIAKSPVHVHQHLRDNFDIDVDKEVVDVLIKDGQKSLSDQFIKFIEENATTATYPLYPKPNAIKQFIQLFNFNSRFSLKEKKKLKAFKYQEYFMGILNETHREIWNYETHDEHRWIIVSPKLANYIVNNIEHFHRDSSKNDVLIHPFGNLADTSEFLRAYIVFVNRWQDENTLYFGTFKKMGYGPMMFYYVAENALTEYKDMGEGIGDITSVSQLDLHHKLHCVGDVKYKKIIFDDDTN